MRVLVTGASGFVGRAVLPRLVEAGHDVVAAVRTPPAFEQPGVTWHPIGDLGSADWTPALAGVDAVLHLAARVHVMNDTVADPLAAFRAVNVIATERLAEAAAAAGVRRFVFVSSIKAMLDHGSDRAVTADDAPVPTTPYGVSKLEAERSVARIAATGDMEFVTFRPPLIYGPGVKGNFLSLMRACERGIPLPLGAIRNRRSIVFLENFADALMTSLDHPAVAGGTYLVHDDVLSVTQLVTEIGRALGKPPRLVPLPAPVAALLRRVPYIAPRVERLTESLHVDDRPFREDASWTPPIGREAAFAETVAAYRREALHA